MIINLRDSEEAESFGIEASLEDLEDLKESVQFFEELGHDLFDIVKDKEIEEHRTWNAAIYCATKAQLCRESMKIARDVLIKKGQL